MSIQVESREIVFNIIRYIELKRPLHYKSIDRRKEGRKSKLGSATEADYNNVTRYKVTTSHDDDIGLDLYLHYSDLTSLHQLKWPEI